MLKFGRTVVKKRIIILIIGLILLIPSAIGFLKTGVNYDVLLYLPDSMENLSYVSLCPGVVSSGNTDIAQALDVIQEPLAGRRLKSHLDLPQ